MSKKLKWFDALKDYWERKRFEVEASLDYGKQLAVARHKARSPPPTTPDASEKK